MYRIEKRIYNSPKLTSNTTSIWARWKIRRNTLTQKSLSTITYACHQTVRNRSLNQHISVQPHHFWRLEKLSAKKTFSLDIEVKQDLANSDLTNDRCSVEFEVVFYSTLTKDKHEIQSTVGIQKDKVRYGNTLMSYFNNFHLTQSQ